MAIGFGNLYCIHTCTHLTRMNWEGCTKCLLGLETCTVYAPMYTFGQNEFGSLFTTQ